jgi:hypothetical protein
MINDMCFLVDTGNHCVMLQCLMHFTAAAGFSTFKMIPISYLFIVTQNNIK